MIKSIGNVPFKGTYRIDRSNNSVDGVAKAIEIMEKTIYDDHEIHAEEFHDLSKTVFTYVVPNSADCTVEDYLIAAGIKFKRFNEETELYSEESVKQRTVLDPRDEAQGYNLVNLNTDAFENAYQNEDVYKGDMQKSSDIARRQGFMRYLRTMQEIYPPKVQLSEKDGKLQMLFEDGRLRYSVMRDMEYHSIPFSLDKYSLRTAQKYGLVD